MVVDALFKLILFGGVYPTIVYVALTLLSFCVAVIFAVPCAITCIVPVLFTVTTFGLLDVHVIALYVELSGLTFAVNCTVFPFSTNLYVCPLVTILVVFTVTILNVFVIVPV